MRLDKLTANAYYCAMVEAMRAAKPHGVMSSDAAYVQWKTDVIGLAQVVCATMPERDVDEFKWDCNQPAGSAVD